MRSTQYRRPHQRLKRLALLLLVLLIVGVAGAFALTHRPTSKPSVAATQPSGPTAQQIKEQNTIHLLAAGDFLAHDTINQAAKQSDGSYNYLPLMDEFVPIFQHADIRFCNDSQVNGGPAYGISGYPKFNSPTEFARDMERVGCNVVNTGTNHSFDRNQAAINTTQNEWASLPNMLAVAGQNKSQAEHDAVHYFTIKGVKFAFLAYTTYINNDAPVQDSYGVNVFSQAFASRQIKEAKAAGAQVILVSMRWGTEYSTVVNGTQTYLAQWLADQGVNIIFGHGSHVLQPVATLTGSGGNKTLVWYSLGDFIGTQLPADTLFNGLATMDLDVKTKRLSNVQFLPIYMHYAWTAAEAARQNNDDLLARHDVKMYFLDQATQNMIDAQQLKTTVQKETHRMQATLNTFMRVPFVTEQQYLAQ